MQNKSMILPIAIFIALFVIYPHSIQAGSNINKADSNIDKAGTTGVSASAETSASDLGEIEKTIKAAEEKLRKRQYEQKAQAGYSKMHEAEMQKCNALKSEIWKLRDSVDELAGKSQKLKADRKKAVEVLGGCIEKSKVLAGKIETITNWIGSRDKQSKEMSAAVETETSARKEKIDNLQKKMSSSTEKIVALQSEKVTLDNESNSQEIEYKAEVNKQNILKNRLASGKKEDAPSEEEVANTKKKIEDFIARAEEREEAAQKLQDEISAVTAANKATEEAISALEAEGLLKGKALEAYSASLEKEKKAANVNIKKLQDEAFDAKSKQMTAAAALKKIEDDIKKNLTTEDAAKKELSVKTEDLKVRISVLVGKMEQGGIFDEAREKARAKEPLTKGAQMSADINDVFAAMKYENDRLMAENKAIKADMQRTEEDLQESRRNADQISKKPEELKATLDKERLELHYNLAVVYEKNGLYGDAEREYLKCLKINPKDPGVHYNLGILYDDKLNKNSLAMDHYWKFLTYRPMGETAERVRDWITKIELEKRLGKEMR